MSRVKDEMARQRIGEIKADVDRKFFLMIKHLIAGRPAMAKGYALAVQALIVEEEWPEPGLHDAAMLEAFGLTQEDIAQSRVPGAPASA